MKFHPSVLLAVFVIVGDIYEEKESIILR